MKTNTLEKSKFKRLVNILKVDNYQSFSHFMNVNTFDKKLATAYEGNDFAFMLLISDKKYHKLFKHHEPEIYQQLMKAIESPQWKFKTETILNEEQINNIKEFFGDSNSSDFLIKYLRSIWQHPDAHAKYMLSLVEKFYTSGDKYNLIYEIYERKEANIINFILNHFRDIDEKKSLKFTKKILARCDSPFDSQLSLKALDYIIKTKGISFIEQNIEEIFTMINPYTFIPFLRETNIDISVLSKTVALFSAAAHRGNQKNELNDYFTQQQILQERERLLMDSDSAAQKTTIMKL